MEKLLTTANRILETNWKGGFTIPTHNLYPFQWNWDSGFICLGHHYYDPAKAIQELQSLFSGQWENGLLPHIIFHSENEKTYFPNFDFWESNVNPGAPQYPKSSGITQPAVHGFILESLLSQYHDSQEIRDFARVLFPKIVNYHRFLYTHRDPHHEGLMCMYHPWESGRDNSPLWDESLDRIHIQPGELPHYERQDNKIADPSERPTDEQYDRFVYLLLLGKKYRYEGPEITAESPFLIQDDMMNAILIRSNEALIRIGIKLGLDVGEITEWYQQGLRSYNDKFWNDELKMYTTYDLRAEKQIVEKEIGGLIPLFAGIPDQEQAGHLHAYLEDLHRRNFYLCPSFDVDSEYFDSKRYWRGPIWPHMNWMLYQGLVQYGFDDIAAVVKRDTIEIVDRFGFFEYFEPQKNIASTLEKGYGGDLFSWTASSIIDLIKAT